MDEAEHDRHHQPHPPRVAHLSGQHQVARGEQRRADEERHRQGHGRAETLGKNHGPQHAGEPERHGQRPVRRIADRLGANDGDGERHEGIDVLRLGPENSGDREPEGEAMTDREPGDDDEQVSHAPADQHETEHERHVIDAGEDVQDAHAQKVQEPGVLQRAGAGCIGDVDDLMVLGHELLGEMPPVVLHLGEVGVAGDELEPGRIGHPDARGIGAGERELVAAIPGQGGDRPGPVGPRAGRPAGAGTDMPRDIRAEVLNRRHGAVRREATRLKLRHGKLQMHDRAADLPGRMGLAAGVGKARHGRPKGRHEQRQQAEAVSSHGHGLPPPMGAAPRPPAS